MVDFADPVLSSGALRDNIRTLIYLFSQELDGRISTFRQGTAYERVRASDIRVFVHAAESESISNIARRLGISRQEELGVIDLRVQAKNRRDLTLVLTEEGQSAMAMAVTHIQRLEAELSEILGTDGIEILRKTLRILIAHIKSKGGIRPDITQPA
jgi:DNA-binding MarR family transcriptional regulator